MDEHIKQIAPILDERQRRLFLASCANTLGYGGLKHVSAVSGASPTTIIKGKKELADGALYCDAIRSKGGGRKTLDEKYPDLQKWIEGIVSEATYGNPENPLLWTTKTVRKIADVILQEHGVKIAFRSVAAQLCKLGYSLQGNRKMLQVGESHPDRNQQFEYINETVRCFVADNQPVISVDTKKKEMIGNYANDGKEYRHKKNPRKTYDHDFPVGELVKVAPYGVYVVNDNTAFVNLGTSHDTSEFAVNSVLRWWETIGKNAFPDANRLLITADCGGSNGYRTRLWKTQLQELANHTGLELQVSHFPPGTSKWNKVEHRLFCFITKNWQGTPLVDVETVVNLISRTKTSTGLTVLCQQDNSTYEIGVKVSDKDLEKVNKVEIPPHGEWNYKILPI